MLLKNYHGMKDALGLSLHRIDNTTHKDYSKPIWLTFTEIHEVGRMVKGLLKAYREMLKDRGETDEEIEKRIDKLIGGKKKGLWEFLKSL